MGDAKVVPTKPLDLPEVGFGRRRVAAVAATKLLARKKKATLLHKTAEAAAHLPVPRGQGQQLAPHPAGFTEKTVVRAQERRSKQRVFVWEMYRNGSGLKGRRTASRATTSSTTPAWSIRIGLYRTMRYCQGEAGSPWINSCPSRST